MNFSVLRFKEKPELLLCIHPDEQAAGWICSKIAMNLSLNAISKFSLTEYSPITFFD